MKQTLIVVLALAIAAACSGMALAQGSPSAEARDGGPGVRAGHITATGETVPNPGASQGAGTTPMDKGIQQRDNKIDSSICKGC